MDQEIKDLIDVSRYYGQKKEYVIAGGGNTSFKNNKYLWIKASGVNLGNIDENGFCVLDRQKLSAIAGRKFSDDPVQRETEVKNVLLDSRKDASSGLRPSVETSLHNLFSYRYVVHTHSTLVNGLMCSSQAEEKSTAIFGPEAIYIPYSDPGYILFKIIEEKISEYNITFNRDPHIILIQNHGVFVAADSVEEVKDIYRDIESKLKDALNVFPEEKDLPLSHRLVKILPALRMMLSGENMKVVTAFNSSQVKPFLSGREKWETGVSVPFTPDQIVYCLPEYLFIDRHETEDELLTHIRQEIESFRSRRGTGPRVLFIRDEGVVVAEDSAVGAGFLKDIVNDFCRISTLSENFGGPHPLSPAEVEFIENWEVENYRKKVARGERDRGRAVHKTIVVTGAAQGFGAGIAEILFQEGANVIIADLNEEKGRQLVSRLNSKKSMNRAWFVPVDVANAESVEKMIDEVIVRFGGLDAMISNAGILHAGSLDEMDQATFEVMTRVNYTGYFLCAKYVQKVMKLQHRYNPGYYMDIIQINSKSGLRGSNKNFAYAGGKFGGIGLTQSFALELMPYHIKVNSICPGNFFEGPLWSDPEKGLFVQYLEAGKVPGAQTIADVKAFYESQVPAGRGCTAKDVAKAIFYVIEQEYETGQAVPVTGGQNMLK